MMRLFLATTGLGVLGAGGVAGLFGYYAQELPPLQGLADYHPPQVTKVYAADGKTLIGEVFEERRTVVALDDVAPVMIQALISAEDKNFYQHAGIDYLGIAKAFVGNLMPGAKTRGASTLTQQIVKTMLLSNERKLSRKIKEAILAHRLEKNFSKQDILYLYLNQIFFGNGRYGIEEASRFYFGKSAKELDVGEAAMLASVPKDPNRVNPRGNVQRLRERQAYVLREMVQNGYIPQAVADRELAKPLKVAPYPEASAGGYYLEEVKRILTEKLGEDALKLGGLRVETRMDPALQAAAERAVRNGLEALDKRQGWRGAKTRIDDLTWDKLRPLVMQGRDAAKEASPESVMDLTRIDPTNLAKASDDDLAFAARQVRWVPREADTVLVARVTSASKAEAIVDLGSMNGVLPLANVSWARKFQPVGFTAAPKAVSDVVHDGDLVTVRLIKVVTCTAALRGRKQCKEDRVELGLEQPPLVEGALISIDPRNRAVLALVGGYDHRRSPFNRATQAKRQPGSSFKPFVYAAALEAGQLRAHVPAESSEEDRRRCVIFHPRQTVFDTPEVIRDKWTGKPWEPRNFERDSFAGPLTLRQALAESKNTVAVKLIGDIGCEPDGSIPQDQWQPHGLAKVKDLARRAGIDSPIPDSITAALGSGEVVPIELVNAYTTFAMDGAYAPPVLIQRVRNPSGQVLYEDKTTLEQPEQWQPGSGPLPAQTGRGLRPELAFVAKQVMRSVVEDPNGTARSLQVLGRPIAGKTGTASEHRDAWFVGFTPEVVTGVWVGFDDHQMLGGRETGGHAAGPIWLQYMKAAEDKVEHLDWSAPPGVVSALIDPRTGLLADDHAPDVETEYYLDGTEPKEVAPPPDAARPEDFFRTEEP